ncbi:hypothetical protein PsorP6_002795 [Peronosclerospora sorghi]|uniref:Uncharacterized protein n=1 Tax=Peronosclerospora sorghi TaxID=230839 RepID=A0ACC0VKC3_9STRA|nr:hypothetical protein PsorP6_002795 [Peronosclerospora sorghi]
MPFRYSIVNLPTSLPLPLDDLGSPSRRLLKARHHDMENMEIKTKTLTAILYSEAIKFTVYKIQIRSTARCIDTGEWTIAKRYSEFFYFRQTLLKHFKKWNLQFHDESKRVQCKDFVLATNLLLPALEIHVFPRKHLRCDTDAIVNERRKKLEQFVRKMLDAYANISVFLYDTQLRNTGAFPNLRKMHQDLEAFLDIPPHQMEINRRQTAAVLALVDVDSEVVAKSDCIECCICLNENDAESNETKGKTVKLPCSHQFHEDCVIEWFNCSTTCPLCRKSAVAEAQWSVDVSIH